MGNKIITKYEYVNEKKELLGYVERWKDEKGDKFFQPHFYKNGILENKGPDKPTPLFGLHLLHRIKEQVIIAEGEKCTKVLQDIGFPAFTNAFGSGSASNADWSKISHAKRVFFFPDNDEQSRKWMNNIVNILLRLNSDIEFFEIDIEPTEKGEDIADWIQERYPEWDGFEQFPKNKCKELASKILTLIETNKKRFTQITIQTKESTKQLDKTNNNFLNELQQKLTFEQILNLAKHDMGKIKTHSNGTMCLSPFCNDTNPSFDYNNEKNLWHCFATQKGGNKFTLIQELMRCDFRQAIDHACNLTNTIKPTYEKHNKSVNFSEVISERDSLLRKLEELPNYDDFNEAFISATPLMYDIAKLTPDIDKIMIDCINKKFKCLNKTFIKDRIKQARIETKLEEPKKEILPEAKREDYYKRFWERFPSANKDIFSNKLLYLNKEENVWKPIENELLKVVSFFDKYQEDHKELSYCAGKIERHLKCWEDNFDSKLVIDIPQWDGMARIEPMANKLKLDAEFAEEYGFTEQSVREIIKEHISIAFERLENPKIQPRMIVLAGNQGIGKDTWVEEFYGALGQFLCRFSRGQTEIDLKSVIHKGLLIHVSEFDRLITNEDSIAMLRELITTPSTHMRMPYDRVSEFRRARCSFIATSNGRNLLRDSTGNRRYIVLEIDSIDWVSLTDNDKLQILAEGKSLAKTSYRISKDTQDAITRYLTTNTPTAIREDALSQWDYQASQFFHELCLRESRVNDTDDLLKDKIKIHTKNGEFSGFLPNFLANSILLKIAKLFKVTDTSIRRTLAKANRHGIVKFHKKTMKGFYFKNFDTNLTDKEIQQMNEETDEDSPIDFI